MDERVAYRSVLAHPEFRAVYLAQALSLVGDQLARIALAILVYRRTGSPLATTATYAVSYLTHLVGGPLLAGLADRYPRLTVMVACDLLRVPLVLAMCVTGVPTWGLFVLIGLLGLAAPPFDSARNALQPDLLGGEAYVVGNTLMNVTVQVSQILGFVLGGALVALTSVRGALVLDAATFLVSAGLLLHAVRQRPAGLSEPGAFLRDAGAGLRLVLARSDLRTLLALAVLGSMAIIGTEGLAVAVAKDLHGGPTLAGVLTATAPIGYLLGSVVVLRVPAERRTGMLPSLVVLASVPLLVTPFTTQTLLVIGLWVVAGVGGTVNLIAGPEFMQRCPPELRGRAYGIAGAALWTSQALGLLAAGLVADALTPRQAVAIVAGATLALGAPLLLPQGNAQIVREEGS